MAGGLLQIASYGIHDIYLIGNPQITFFKIVYKRHTNFSMEYLEEVLDGEHNFGGKLNCTLAKTGDLLYRIYLKINLPNVSIYYNNINTNYEEYNIFIEKNKKISNYINIVNYNIIEKLYDILEFDNLNYININNKYLLYKKQINYENLNSTIENINIKFTNNFYIPLNPNSSIIIAGQNINLLNYLDIDKYYNKYINTTVLSSNIKSSLKKLLDEYRLLLKILKINMNKLNIYYSKVNNIYLRNNINFSWVENIGYQIIKKINIEIGGKQIDFIDDVRMDIHNQLTNKILHKITLDKLIGNVKELTTYNIEPKPSYTLLIPINFWFSKYSGSALPLIHLRYHEVKINIELNDLINCCYYEKINDLIIEDEIKLIGNVSLIANYIYLDNIEREKFSKSEHEYLIDQTQKIELKNTDTNSTMIDIINVQLSFFNPIKQLFWLIRNVDNIERGIYFNYSCDIFIDIYEFDFNNINEIKINTVMFDISKYIFINDYIEIINSIYYSGIYKVINIINNYIIINFPIFIQENYKYNYNYTDNIYSKSDNYLGSNQAFIKKINNCSPIRYTTIELNGIKLLNKVDDIYTNFVQPYQYNSNTPNYGINTYSFALFPELLQPSGFCNFNKIENINAIFYLNKQYINNESIILIYAQSYNILKFVNGKAGIIMNI